MNDIELIVRLQYEDVFDEIDFNGVMLPISALKDIPTIKKLIANCIEHLEPTEAIQYTAFLNMIVQTYEPEEVVKLSQQEINFLKRSPWHHSKKVLLTRNNLVILLSLLIRKKDTGTLKIMTHPNNKNVTLYYKALLLINNWMNLLPSNENTFRFYNILREYPFPHSPKTTSTTYRHWLIRYEHIYRELLPSLPDVHRKHLTKAIDDLEKNLKISLTDYFYIIFGLFSWFLLLPLYKDEILKTGGSVDCFSKENKRTFYIVKENFKNGGRFLSLFEATSRTLHEFEEESISLEKKTAKFSPLHKEILNIFNNPLFKVSIELHCLLDLKLLIEGITNSLFWRLQRSSSIDIRTLKSPYGYLLENYFTELMNNIFSGDSHTDHTEDYKLFSDSCDLVFEFTTSYYFVETFYTDNIDDFKTDLDRLLFNDKLVGKLTQLNRHIEGITTKKIIPILVTERYIGDYDLLNSLNNYLDEKINKHDLENLKKHKPLIISLDDLEFFWKFCSTNKQEALTQFTQCVEAWENTDKGKFLYIFSYFIEDYFSKVRRAFNPDYQVFFASNKFFSKQDPAKK